MKERGSNLPSAVEGGMVAAAGDTDRRETEDLKQSDRGLGQQPFFYCNSPLSK